MSDSVTKVFAAAFPVRLTVHVDEPAVVKEVGVQLKEFSVAESAVRLIAAERLMLFNVPVTVAVSLVETVPLVTVNVLLVAPFGIVTLAGVVNWAELSERLTTVAPTAAWLREAVQVEL